MTKFNQKLVKELKFLLDSEPFIGKSVEENPYGYGKDGVVLVDLLEACGYETELHQGGIRGTSIVLVPKEPRK